MYGANILIDNEQDIFITGSFKGTLIFQHLTLSSSLDWLSFIFKLDRNGNVEWGKNLFGNHDIIMDLVKTDVGIYVYGVSINPFIDFGDFILYNSVPDFYYFLAKMDEDGNFHWATATGGNGNLNDGNIIANSTNDIYISGTFWEPSIQIGSMTLISEGGSDFLLAKLTDTTVGIDDFENSAFTLYPNPFSTQATLFTGKELHNATLTITNALGQVVKRMDNLNGNHIPIERGDLASGVYFARVSEGNKVLTTKKVIIK